MIKILNIIFIVLLLNSCGSGGSSSTQSKDEESIKKNPSPLEPPEKIINQSLPYKKYAWHINKNIDINFKNKYNIKDNSHINIEEVWKETRGLKTNKEPIRVAIIDEDFEVNHPEIKNKIYAKYNIMNETNNVSNTSNSEYSHGTATAGFIASDTIGVAPDVELILLNIDLKETKDSPSNLTEKDIIKALYMAKELGAKVINCSWGSNGEGQISEMLKLTIEYLEKKGINIIFASGNEGTNLNNSNNLTETKLNSVITVGATSVLNDITEYSNYGREVNILAPGGGDGKYNLIGILGLDKQSTKGINPYFDKNKYIPGNDLVSSNFSFTQGTSFATPIVSGVVALMLSVNPDLTPKEIRNILSKTADKVGINNGAYYENGFDYKRAYGKINALKAINLAKSKIK